MKIHEEVGDYIDDTQEAAREQRQDLVKEIGVEDLIVESPVIHLYKKEEDFKSALSIWKILKNKGIDYEELDEPLVRENEPNLSSDYHFGVLFQNSGFSSNPFRLVEKMSERFLSDGGDFIHEYVQNIKSDEHGKITLKLENREIQ